MLHDRFAEPIHISLNRVLRVELLVVTSDPMCSTFGQVVSTVSTVDTDRPVRPLPPEATYHDVSFLRCLTHRELLLFQAQPVLPYNLRVLSILAHQSYNRACGPKA